MSVSEEASETAMQKISLDLSQAYVQDGTASYQPAPPLETSSNGVAPAMTATGSAYDAGMQTSELLLQPQPSVGAPLSDAQDGTPSNQHAAALALLTFSNGVTPAMRAPKRKRGRPRKSDLLAAMPLAPPPPANATQCVKKKRVRGPSSTANKQKVTAAGSGVNGLNPEVITIQPGEDVATKVMSYSGNESAVYVLSAHGVVSNVTLRQGAIHEAITYEGHFEILSLSGSYQLSETDGMSTRKGGLSVLFAGLDGRLFGGGVAGALIAASPVQVVIERFPVEGKKKLKRGEASGTPGASGSSGISQY